MFKRVRKQSGRTAIRFQTWIDPKTGQLCFAEEGKQPPTLANREWQRLELHCFYDKEMKRIRLKEEAPSVVNFAPEALRIFQESIRALKQLEDSIPCNIHVIDQLVINKTWHDVDRYQAEALLFTKPVGTYLFRKDAFAQILEEQLIS